MHSEGGERGYLSQARLKGVEVVEVGGLEAIGERMVMDKN